MRHHGADHQGSAKAFESSLRGLEAFRVNSIPCPAEQAAADSWRLSWLAESLTLAVSPQPFEALPKGR